MRGASEASHGLCPTHISKFKTIMCFPEPLMKLIANLNFNSAPSKASSTNAMTGKLSPVVAFWAHGCTVLRLES